MDKYLGTFFDTDCHEWVKVTKNDAPDPAFYLVHFSDGYTLRWCVGSVHKLVDKGSWIRGKEK